MTYTFRNTKELKEILKNKKISLYDFFIERECYLFDRKKEDVIKELTEKVLITRSAIEKGLKEPQVSFSGLTQGSANKVWKNKAFLIKDNFYQKAIMYSLAIIEVNACSGKIVSFPTAGSCGIVPGLLWAYKDAYDITDDKLLEGFVAASCVGMLISINATLAGAEGGCQAECGAAAAMAAAGVMYIIKKDLNSMFNAASLSLKNTLGLACDPVAGLVEVPCVKRNAFMVSNSITAIELTLNNVKSIIPFDEVIMAMKNISSVLPYSLKESATGGLAITPTAKKYEEKIK